MRPATPAAAMVWPRLVLIEPMAQYWVRSVSVSEGARQSLELDRITQLGAGAVRLDHANACGMDVESLVDLTRQAFLGASAGCGDAVGLAVLIEGRSADDAVDVIARCNRVRKALEDHDPDALAEDEAVGPLVESIAPTRMGQHAALVGSEE